MKVLWFTQISAHYDNTNHQYNGCGWSESLETILSKEKSIELGVCFFHPTDNKKCVINGTVYYPLRNNMKNKNPIIKLINNWKGKINFKNLKEQTDRVISDFKPDIIQVFGTEGVFSNLIFETKIPIVFHLQGLIGPILNSYFPVNQSAKLFFINFDYFINNLEGNSPAFDFKRFKNQSIREDRVLKFGKYFTGRTSWDKRVLQIYNSEAIYFHINEVLRSPFYEVLSNKKNRNNDKLIIISTISPTIYKGIDFILKTANLLKTMTSIEFQWNVIGVDSSSKLISHFEKTEKLRYKDLNVCFMGSKNAEDLIKNLSIADLYVHPSYIENSPNSVCEAQIIGVPIIACNVGGISSLIKNEETGILIPSNGVYELVSYITEFSINKSKFLKFADNAKEVAIIRHDKRIILENLIETYLEILKLENVCYF